MLERPWAERCALEDTAEINGLTQISFVDLAKIIFNRVSEVHSVTQATKSIQER